MNLTVDIDGGVTLDKDERPPIPVLTGFAEVANAVSNLVHSCWVREPSHRPSFASVSASLEEVWRLQSHGSPQFRRASTPMINVGSALASTESSPADEQYETAPESMTTDVEEENMDSMTDVPLTSPGPGHLNGINHAEGMMVLTQVPSGVFEYQDKDTPTPSPTKDLDVDTRNEENYRLLVGSNHAFHKSRKFVSLKVYGMLNQNVLVLSDAPSMVPDARRTWCSRIHFQAQGRVYHVVQCD